MAMPQVRPGQREGRWKRFGETVHRAFVEFLRLPILIIAGLLLMAAGTWVLDFTEVRWLDSTRAAMREHLFRDAQATTNLLATIAGSIITVTSITFSLLLLVVQQAAAGALTHQVYDQFLRRKVNQGYFGFFVGLAVYTLVVLATVNPPYNPVFGASLALLLTIVALTLMILLLYTTVNQMRPVVVIETIHDHALVAREGQRELLGRTRRTARLAAAGATPVYATAHGYVVRVDIDSLATVAGKAQRAVEIVLRVSIGNYVAFRDTLGDVRGASPQEAAEVAKRVLEAVSLEQQRDLDTDAAYGIEQLAIIGWTSISTAKSNPSPGIMALHSPRDLLARWCAEPVHDGALEQVGAGKGRVPVVYSDDVFAKLFDAFETLAVVASESMQSQTMAEVARTLAMMFERLPADCRPQAEDLIRRSLSALGEHVLMAELNAALSNLVHALDTAGRHDTAAAVQAAQNTLGASIGQLGSRATRVSASD